MLILLTSCKTTEHVIINNCQPIVDYSDKFLEKSRQELKQLGNESAIWQMMIDYAVERNMLKQCKE